MQNVELNQLERALCKAQITGDEREAVVKARVNQGLFRVDCYDGLETPNLLELYEQGAKHIVRRAF